MIMSKFSFDKGSWLCKGSWDAEGLNVTKIILSFILQKVFVPGHTYDQTSRVMPALMLVKTHQWNATNSSVPKPIFDGFNGRSNQIKV